MKAVGIKFKQDGKVYTISNVYFERPSARLVEIISFLNEIG